MAVPPRIRETRIQLTPKFYYSSRKAFYKEQAVGAMRTRMPSHRTHVVDAAYDGRRPKREQTASDLINCGRRWTLRTSKTRLNSSGTPLTHMPRVREDSELTTGAFPCLAQFNWRRRGLRANSAAPAYIRELVSEADGLNALHVCKIISHSPVAMSSGKSPS
jgi:hypothetical protein